MSTTFSKKIAKNFVFYYSKRKQYFFVAFCTLAAHNITVFLRFYGQRSAGRSGLCSRVRDLQEDQGSAVGSEICRKIRALQ